MSSIEGIVGVWLGRCLGSFTLLRLKRGRMPFSKGLVMAQLVLAIQVSNTHEGQLHRATDCTGTWAAALASLA